jgi:hypothetical protein
VRIYNEKETHKKENQHIFDEFTHKFKKLVDEKELYTNVHNKVISGIKTKLQL